jgi:septal ring factor EnvC (AmiA/AmiB activator)
MNETIILALITALTSGGTLAFIQYLIARSDTQKEKKDDKLKDVNQKLDNDDKRIKKLEEDIGYIKKTQTQTLQALLVILDELKKNNDVDGIIQKTESDMQSFLLNNR